MSRCFPYPPPGHMRNGARGEAVSESIKLQNDWKKAVTELDIKNKKEKKEKREKKKKSSKEKKDVYSVAMSNQRGENLPKGKQEETERSSVTEEHGQPVCSQSLCYSSDSSRSSRKRKADVLVHDATKTHGEVIRIRLPLQRHREPDVSSSNHERLCSTSRGVDVLPDQKQVLTLPRQEQCGSINSKTVRKLPLAPTKPTSSKDLGKKEKSSRTKKEKKQRKAEKRYKALFEDWVPPPMDYDQIGLKDEEWLSETTGQGQERDKRLKTSDYDEPSNEGRAFCFWSCARFLPQADIYALPYTSPF